MILHPGVIPVLRKLNANELDIAKMVRDGDLTSPQRFHNVSLYNIRITGTGVSHRPALDEYVFRKPENYLTDEFLARCNGLAVIMHHPEKSLLTSDEFADRVVGSVMLPYIRGDEVWAVAKIYDDEAIQDLSERQMSTSPAVLLSKSKRVTLDGKNLLVEGEPTLLDHIALCHNGVWDKGGDPTGVEIIEDHQTRKDSTMAEHDDKGKEKEEREEKERADAAARADEQFDALLKGIDSVKSMIDSANARMDALEKEGEDGETEEEREEKEREEKEREEKERGEKGAKEVVADKKRSDARADALDAAMVKIDELSTALKRQDDDQKATLRRLEELVRKPFSDEHRAELTAAQARADAVMTNFGEEAPRAMSGETPLTYRRRLVGKLQQHSPQWAKVRLDDLGGDAFSIAEDQIYADAVKAARTPVGLAKGQIVERTHRSPSGHMITEFYGSDTHFVHQWRRPLRRVGRFRVPG